MITQEKAGSISRWDDSKGFGFIKPADGGGDVFAHISVVRGDRRPLAGDQVMYVLGRDANNRAKAEHVRLAGQLAVDREQIRQKPRAPRAEAKKIRPKTVGREQDGLLIRNFGAKLLALVGLCLLPLAGSAILLRSGVPWVLLLYTGASLLSVVQYSLDKRSAQRGGQRISENTLHLVELAGGWPGALIAQQLFRHKTSKASYRATFWLIVAAHEVFWIDWLVFDGAYIAHHLQRFI